MRFIHDKAPEPALRERYYQICSMDAVDKVKAKVLQREKIVGCNREEPSHSKTETIRIEFLLQPKFADDRNNLIKGNGGWVERANLPRQSYWRDVVSPRVDFEKIEP